jgi:hypothetical protein
VPTTEVIASHNGSSDFRFPSDRQRDSLLHWQGMSMHRREFICGVAGAVTAAPSLTLRTAAAQVRRIGVLMGTNESDSGGFFAAFVEDWHD